MKEQEFIGDEIVHAAEEWQQIADITETVSGKFHRKCDNRYTFANATLALSGYREVP